VNGGLPQVAQDAGTDRLLIDAPRLTVIPQPVTSSSGQKSGTWLKSITQVPPVYRAVGRLIGLNVSPSPVEANARADGAAARTAESATSFAPGDAWTPDCIDEARIVRPNTSAASRFTVGSDRQADLESAQVTAGAPYEV
jgi:hypothetical protein